MYRCGPPPRQPPAPAARIAAAGEWRPPGLGSTGCGLPAARVNTDGPLARLTVLWLTDRGRAVRPSVHAAAFSQPKVIPRVDWGADESLRYDSTGKETWPPAFYPVQKLIVHHTDTQ